MLALDLKIQTSEKSAINEKSEAAGIFNNNLLIMENMWYPTEYLMSYQKQWTSCVSVTRTYKVSLDNY